MIDNLVDAFKRQKNLTPNAIASSMGDESLTYEGLYYRAIRLAKFLFIQGVTPGQMVPICVERSIDMLVGIWGILFAGCAYVPLDPTYPEERLQYVLQDLQAEIVVSHRASSAKVASNKNKQTKIIFLDDIEFDKITLNDADEVCAAVGSDLAYVIYTSGSTGTPKGVMIEHRSIVARLQSLVELYELHSDDVCIHYRSFAYDASLEELILPVVAGAKVIIAPQSFCGALLEKLVLLIAESGVTTINLMPNILPSFLRYVEKNSLLQRCASLRRVVAGGEELTPSMLQEFYALFSIPLFHMYGPTEVTIDALCWKCDPTVMLDKLPIGKPLPYTSAVILDEALRPVAPGQTGELFLSGIGLARGYLNDTAKTKAQFVTLERSRWYKTGDLVKLLPDGDYVFAGRADRQLKIRGIRVELDEIAAEIMKYPGIENCKIVPFADSLGDKILAAYLVCKNKSTFSLTDFKYRIGKSLPVHMIPARVFLLDKLPLLPNGKVYIDKLVTMATTNQLVRTEKYIKPANRTEEIIVDVFTQILSISKGSIGIDDNFFSVGGYSLAAIEAACQIADYLDCRLESSIIFEFPTARKLAEYVIKHDAQKLTVKKRIRKQDNYELSSSQQQIWLHQQMAPNMPLYNEPLVVNMYEEIDSSVMEKSVNDLVKRQEVLRTRIFLNKTRPRQKFVNYRHQKLKFLDFSQMLERKRQKAFAETVKLLITNPFKLETEQPIRMMLIKIDHSFFKLVMCLHHVVTDGITAFGILVPELESIYRDLMDGKREHVELSPTRYVDYIATQVNYKNSAQYLNDMEYWTDKFANYEQSSYPFISPENPADVAGEMKYFYIAYDTYLVVQNLSNRLNVTIFSILFAVFCILLHKYSATNDIVIGTTVADRNESRFQNIVGNFLNTLMLRNNVSSDLSFLDVLEEINKSVIEAIQHKSFPLSDLLKQLPTKQKSFATPFQVAFVFEPEIARSESKWVVTQSDVHPGTAKFPLTFELDQKSAGVFGRVEYRINAIEAKLVENMISHYQQLLATVVNQPDILVKNLSCLNYGDISMLTTEWGRGKVKLPSSNIIELFERCAALQPNNVAVECYGKLVTYQQLNLAANQIARSIIDLNLEHNSIIPISIEKSISLIIAILAVLKAGHAFVIVDPDLPPKRREVIFADIQPQCICVAEGAAVDLPSSTSIVPLDLNGLLNFNPVLPNPNIPIAQNDLAYIVYTSGTTGVPKGVMIEHRGLANTITAQVETFAMRADTKVLSLAFPGFDAFISEAFTSLVSGAHLYLPSFKGAPSVQMLTDTINGVEANLLTITPSLLRLLTPKEFPRLKTLIVAGEACSQELIEQWSTKKRRLINAYGPSECTICATMEVITDPSKSVTIGKPINNTVVYALDPERQLVPPGVVGELYVGGLGAARGYLNRPDLTKRCFIPNPFSNKPGEQLLYKTGDMVKWAFDGKLEFVGRQDEQVKIRGCRVELPEVENHLRSYEHVKDCVVVTKTKSNNDLELIGYVVTKRGTTLSLADLKNHCVEFLPSYMIPSRFFKLDQVPLTDSGKVDKSKLDSAKDIQNNTAKEPPKELSPIQNKLIEMWQKILDVTDVPLSEHFFDLGGTSLTVIELLAEIQKHFAVKLEPHTFCTIGTISKLSDFIGEVAVLQMKE